MNKHITNRYRIASLTSRMLRIISISLTIVCAIALAEAHDQAHPPFHYDIIKTKPSLNYNSRIRYMIIHSKDAQAYTNKHANSTDNVTHAHYIVSSTKNNLGQIIIHQKLPEDQYVQGLSEACWASKRYVNTCSIVIMVLHTTDEQGCKHFLPEQMDALAALVQDLAQRYAIPANAVLDLSDVMAGSITSTAFDWESLHKEWHIGPWPDEEDVTDHLHATDPSINIDYSIDKEQFLTNLALYGYPIPLPIYEDAEPYNAAVQKVIASFQCHFRPTKCDGLIDRETVAILEALIKKYGTQPIYFKRFIN